MGLSVSTLGFLTFACYAIIFGFMWRSAAAHYHDRPIGQAMAFIF